MKKNFKDLGIFSIINSTFHHLSLKRRRQIGYLLIFTLFNSVFELLSLSAVYPFLIFIIEPNFFEKNPEIVNIFQNFNIYSEQEVLISLLTLFLGSIILSSIFKIFFTYYSLWVCGVSGSELASKTYMQTINKPYSYHLKKNSNMFISTIVKDIDDIIYHVFFPFINLISGLFLFVLIISFLLFINLNLIILSFSMLGITYFVIVLVTSRKVKKLSKLNIKNSQLLTKLVQEALGSIRDIILSNNQKIYINNFSKSDISHRKNMAFATFIIQLPKLIIEPLGVFLISVIGFYLFKKNSIEEGLALIGLLTFSILKLLPYSQRIYEGITYPKIMKSKLINILDILENSCDDNISTNYPLGKIDFQKLELSNISFKYDKDESLILENLNLEITKGDKIGIIGKTGSGKSTLVDLINGLLKPTSGKILINNLDLYSPSNQLSNLEKSWQNSLINVPQNIFLADCSILENIALGEKKINIKTKRIKEVLEIAQLNSDIINSKLSLNTIVGERGVRLSGGQKQRIGIARALYKKSSFILLDEATSSLDNETEQKLMKSLNDFYLNTTVLIIAHRLNTLKGCNKIYELKNGRLNKINVGEIK